MTEPESEPTLRTQLEALRDVPAGQHPFDGYLHALTAVLGEARTARYLGVANWQEKP